MTFAISKAAPTVTVSDAGGTYSGSGFPATGLVNGGATLESVGTTLAYYAGTTATGTSSSTAPSAAGTYTVVASFPGSTNYTSASAAQRSRSARFRRPAASRPCRRTSLTSFTVSWSGTAGSGGPITSFNIFVSTNGTSSEWQTATTATSATFRAAIGNTYAFSSQAADTSGNVEPLHATADTTITTTATPWQNPNNNHLDVIGKGGAITPFDALLVIDYLNANAPGTPLPASQPVGGYYLDVLGKNVIYPLDVLTIFDYLNAQAAMSVASASVVPATVASTTVDSAAVTASSATSDSAAASAALATRRRRKAARGPSAQPSWRSARAVSLSATAPSAAQPLAVPRATRPRLPVPGQPPTRSR